MNVLPFIPDESIDLIVSDPPYLIDYQSNRRTKTPKFNKMRNDIDALELIKYYFQQCYRILKPNSSIYIFCSWKTIEYFKTSFEYYDLNGRRIDLFKTKNVLVWRKNIWGSGDLKGSYAPQHEFILYGHKGRDTLRGKRYSDILEFSKIPSARLLHPAQKPIELLEFLIENSSDPGNLVFDGFAGIGSTGIAAKRKNRNYIMCEIDKDYYNMGKRLLNGN